MLTEKRLIDANALKEKLQKHHDFFVDGVGVGGVLFNGFCCNL